MDLTVRDAARLLHTSEKAVYRWIKDGTLPSYRLNDKIRLNRVDLLEWATARNIKVSPGIFREEQDATPQTLLTTAVRVGGVLYDIPGADKASVLKGVCDRIPVPENVSRDELYGVLLAREALSSTAIGNGIAIPHPRSPLVLGVKEPSVSVAFLAQPVSFGALDGKPVTTLFTIISTTVRIHLQLLSHLMASLQDQEFADLLHKRAKAEEIVSALERIESGFGKTSGAAGDQA